MNLNKELFTNGRNSKNQKILSMISLFGTMNIGLCTFTSKHLKEEKHFGNNKLQAQIIKITT